jgi:hypothetical protein
MISGITGDNDVRYEYLCRGYSYQFIGDIRAANRIVAQCLVKRYTTVERNRRMI